MSLYFSLPDLFQPAVVPVVANLGTALLPAILAGLASVGALLVNPKRMWQAIRNHPGRVIGLVIGLLLLSGLSWWILVAKSPSGLRAASARSGSISTELVGTTDWTKVALELIRQEQRSALSPPSIIPRAGIVPELPSTPASPTLMPKSAHAPTTLLFRGDPQRTGYGGGAAPRGLQPVWEFHEENTMVLSAPLVTDDAVFAASCYLDSPKSYGGVFCLDRATGVVRWNTQSISIAGTDTDLMGFFSSPALSADRTHLVIGQGLHPDSNAALLCFDTADGHLVWSAPTTLHIEGSPVITGDLVIAGAGAIEEPETHKPIGEIGYVFAVNLADGKERWRYLVADPESSPVAAADGSAVYIGSGFNGNAVVALRTADDASLATAHQDRLLWRVETPYPATGAVTLAGDTVLIGCGNGDFVFAAKKSAGQVMAIDATSGAVRWVCPLDDGVLGAIAVADGVAYAPVRNGALVAIELATGMIRWQQSDPQQRTSTSLRAALLTGPAIAQGLLYSVSSDGWLAIFDAATGSLLERSFVNGPAGERNLSVSSAWVANNHVYVGSETGGLRCLTGSTAGATP